MNPFGLSLSKPFDRLKANGFLYSAINRAESIIKSPVRGAFFLGLSLFHFHIIREREGEEACSTSVRLAKPTKCTDDVGMELDCRCDNSTYELKSKH